MLNLNNILFQYSNHRTVDSHYCNVKINEDSIEIEKVKKSWFDFLSIFPIILYFEKPITSNYKFKTTVCLSNESEIVLGSYYINVFKVKSIYWAKFTIVFFIKDNDQRIMLYNILNTHFKLITNK